MIVMGFVEPFTKELPMEYAVELNRLIAYEMEGSVGWLPRADSFKAVQARQTPH